jgi:hypothetical protein
MQVYALTSSEGRLAELIQMRDGIERAVRVELTSGELEWLEATAAVVFGRPGAPASDLLRVFVISAQQQMTAQSAQHVQG